MKLQEQLDSLQRLGRVAAAGANGWRLAEMEELHTELAVQRHLLSEMQVDLTAPPTITARAPQWDNSALHCSVDQPAARRLVQAEAQARALEEVLEEHEAALSTAQQDLSELSASSL